MDKVAGEDGALGLIALDEGTHLENQRFWIGLCGNRFGGMSR
jgi:hypothetical protein